MINTGKINWLIVGLILLLLVLSYPVYHFFVIVPNKNLIAKQKLDELAQQQDCMKMGQDYVARYETELKNHIVMTKTLISPIYHFNKKLQTCLVETGEKTFYSTGNFSTYKFILDLYTNAKLASITFDEDTKYNHPEIWTQDIENYDKRKIELFELPELPKLPTINSNLN